ncbi:MAG TPA: oligosaccharide flippase family protein [Gaiellaceae bacterium]|jgi:O-antigen/teichoic acid export membrane protein|nr:oligosaccharide flippase family protein [Gaiellaceae bacterium]
MEDRAAATGAHDAGGESVRRSALFSGAVQVAGIVLTSILTLFLVRSLGRADYGRYAIVLAVGAIVLLPSDLGISTSTGRSLAESFGDAMRIRLVLGVALRLKIVLSLATGAAIAALAPVIADGYGDRALVLPLRLMGLAIAAHAMFAFVSASFTALRQMQWVFRIVTLESVVETTTAIALVLAGAGVAGAVAGRAAGYGLGAAIGLLALLARHGGPRGVIRERFDRGLARRLALYAGAVAVVDVIWAILSQIDVLIIGALLTPTAVASFQAPSRLLSLATYPGLALSYAVGPRLARRDVTGAAMVRTLSTTARMLVVVQGVAAAATIVFAQPIVAIALGGSYEHTSAESVLRCLAPYVALSGLAPLFSNAIDYVGGARRRIWIAAATLGVNVTLNLVLLPLIGPVGAAVALDVGYCLFVGGHVLLAGRLLDVELRPLGATAVRTALAAAGMIMVAYVLGWAVPGVPGIALGVVTGVAAFAAILLSDPTERRLVADGARILLSRGAQGSPAAGR